MHTFAESYEGAQTKRPRQNVPWDKTSHRHKIPRTKRPMDKSPKGQNVLQDTMSNTSITKFSKAHFLRMH